MDLERAEIARLAHHVDRGTAVFAFVEVAAVCEGDAGNAGNLRDTRGKLGRGVAVFRLDHDIA